MPPVYSHVCMCTSKAHGHTQWTPRDLNFITHLEYPWYWSVHYTFAQSSRWMWPSCLVLDWVSPLVALKPRAVISWSSVWQTGKVFPWLSAQRSAPHCPSPFLPTRMCPKTVEWNRDKATGFPRMRGWARSKDGGGQSKVGARQFFTLITDTVHS